MDNAQTRSIVFLVIAFIVGWAVGLFIFGWWLTPVQYEGAGPQHLLKSDQDIYLIALADLYSFDNNQARVQEALGDWPEADQAICQLANETTDAALTARLNALATVLNQSGCAPLGAPPPEEDGGGILGILVAVCGIIALLAVALGAIYLVWQRRSGDSGEAPAPSYDDSPVITPVSADVDAGQQITPIARFQTTYTRGHDTYDESFSIENMAGDFLGECGVGLSETIGADAPKNVTAFEVWLFDKNDIRTVTKVVMSDHAFFDEAIKAKLAPKGEPVLARPNETIVLETASLIINAEITEMDYGTGNLEPQSYFERFTVELSAWAKEGDFGEPDVQGRVDEMLDF
jgi:hypothetical protein